MGIDYSLANHKDKTAYELGKGSWSAFLSDNCKTGHECLLYEDAIYEMIVEEVWDYLIDDPTENAEEWRQYAKEIASEIFKFVNNVDPSQIILCNDCDDSDYMLKEKGYRWVGSRYRNVDLDCLNRHLKAK